MKKIILIAFLVISVVFIIACTNESFDASKSNEENNVQPEITKEIETFDETKFNQMAIDFLYSNGFCYVGMEEEEGIFCGEADYPFIRVYNAEDYTERGKIFLITKVTDDLYDNFPSLYDKEIVYVFRDKNQKSVDRIYVKENKWER